MTKVITRYFGDVDAANRAQSDLVNIRQVSRRITFLCDSAEDVSRLTKAGVDPATLAAYRDRLAHGGGVLMVLAGYQPLGVARIVRDVCAEMGADRLGGLVEDVTVADRKDFETSILTGHPRFLTRQSDPEQTNFHMANWPIPLISRRKPGTFSLFGPHARMASWPIPLLSKKVPFTFSLFEPHARMADRPVPLLSDRKPYDGFAFSRHARMANFPIPLISRRKPYTETWIGKHPRMANWPFPHLMNGTSNNSLVPGGARMANFPISLLSDRKPFDGSIFSRHARMANFPLPLLSKRKPFTGSVFSPHARMANYILPLIVKKFSFSSLFGMPTLAKR